MEIPTPKGWRKGQTIFNFLEWLRTIKGYEHDQSSRMGDCFYISDEDLDKLFDEYISLNL